MSQEKTTYKPKRENVAKLEAFLSKINNKEEIIDKNKTSNGKFTR